MSKRVFVGMSGGVDSSVSAALLVQQGYDVTGVYMKNWARDLPGFQCPWKRDYQDALRVAVGLGIELRVYDFQADYQQRVVDYMIDGYQQGVTPNPDIMCNQEIKFKLFLDTALADGADMIATGHYARIKSRRLMRAVDDIKDQTYFLYRISSEAIEKSMFPIGDMTKDDVRLHARKLGLSTADKKDSQGICFVGDIGIREFLEHFVDTAPGDIMDAASGEVLGRHDGALFYTIGQRHGLGIGGGMPYYVVSKDMSKNIVYVTKDIQDSSLWATEVELTSTYWLTDIEGVGGSDVRARYRHGGPLVPARLEDVAATSARVVSESAIRAVTPGQSVVVYSGDVVMGGGIVTRTS
jgi:tRNA-uridine 2-sulfurtransferase